MRKIAGKHLCQILIPATLLKKTLAQMFSCEFCKIFESIFGQLLLSFRNSLSLKDYSYTFYLLFLSTALWSNIVIRNILSVAAAKTNDDIVFLPLVLGSGIFPTRWFLLKPYGDAVVSEKKIHFNYRASWGEGLLRKIEGCIAPFI